MVVQLKKQYNKFLLIISLIFLFTFNIHPTQSHEYLTELFPVDLVTTEFDAYKLLMQEPLSQPVDYIAIPWAVLINRNQLHLVPKIQFNDAPSFTICQHIKFESIIPTLKQMGVTTLFTPHAKKNKNYGMTVLPFPHAPVNGIGPAEHKDLLYSFIGFNTHPIRLKIFKFPKHPHTIIKQRFNWHYSGNANKQAQEKKEYQDVLARSRFSLCPRGTGPSTIRFWESLQAGAIPVLYGDDLWLPKEYDWSSCVIYIPEKDVNKTYEILSNISPEQEDLMRESCIRAYNKFCGKNLVSTIRHYYKDQ